MIQSSPLHLNQRNFSIDTMRGFAILGILLMNIGGFSSPDFFFFWTDVLHGHMTLDGFIVKATMVLFEGKMRGLFTLLFGAGLMLFIVNKDSSLRTADLYFKRLMWLVIFGMVDAYLLLWTGDILFEYAFCGLFLFALRNLRVRYMILISLLSITLVTFLAGKDFSEPKGWYEEYMQLGQQISKGKKLSEEQEGQKKRFEKFFGNHYPFSKETVKEISTEYANTIKIHKQGYPEIFGKHSAEVYEYQSSELYSSIWESLGMVLLGMALFKIGFFSYGINLNIYRLICFIGIPLGWALASYGIHLQFHTRVEMLTAFQWRNFSTVWLEQGGRILTTLGYASLIMLLCRVKFLKRFLNLFANTGRMALTNYIMQTVLCSLWFYGFGFAHYGEYGPPKLVAFILCIWIIQIAYSNILLKYFNMGPMEWLWRRLTYGAKNSSSHTGPKTELKESPSG